MVLHRRDRFFLETSLYKKVRPLVRFFKKLVFFRRDEFVIEELDSSRRVEFFIEEFVVRDEISLDSS